MIFASSPPDVLVTSDRKWLWKEVSGFFFVCFFLSFFNFLTSAKSCAAQLRRVKGFIQTLLEKTRPDCGSLFQIKF